MREPMSRDSARHPNLRRLLPALPCLALVALVQGCVSTEALYAEYDARACRVALESSSGGGDTRVRELGTERTMRWEPVIGFALDDATLDARATRRLDLDVAVLRAFPTLRVSVRGFADASGTRAHNREVAARRVSAVLAHLAARGIDLARTDALPIGEGVPLVADGRRATPALERRVELSLTDADGLAVPLLVRPAGAGDADEGR